MKQLTNNVNQFMSSKEIAHLTGKRHDHVVRDIRGMIEQLDAPNLGHEQYQELKDSRGYTSEFLLDHDLSVLLITGYDVKARLKVIQRWKELEQQAIKIHAIPQTLSQALRLAADQQDQIEHQKALIATQAPMVEFHERFINAEGVHSITVTAKALDMKRTEFIERCIAAKVLYRDSHNTLIPYEQWKSYGYLVMKEGEHNSKKRPQTYFTAKGFAWIGKRLIKAEQVRKAEQALSTGGAV